MTSAADALPQLREYSPETSAEVQRIFHGDAEILDALATSNPLLWKLIEQRRKACPHPRPFRDLLLQVKDEAERWSQR